MPAYYKATAKYKKAVTAALGKEAPKQSEINIIFVDAKEILKINKQFLNHNYVTDVISFNYPYFNLAGGPFGDVFVCFEQAKKQAKEQKHGALRELMVLAVHGALHLIGYEDDTPKKRDRMNAYAEKITKDIL